MSTNDMGGHDLTPPPSPTPTPPATPAPRSDRAGVRPITVVLSVIGGVALASAGVTAAFAAGNQLARVDSFDTADVSGIRSVDVDISASDVTVEFGDVDEAQLQVEGGRGGSWTLERDDDELLLHSPSPFGLWFGDWFASEGRVVLTLPESLGEAGLDFDLDLSAGSLTVTGDFGDVEAAVGAGELWVEGTADSVDADVSAGRAEIRLENVAEADFVVSAGHLSAELTGSAPDEVTIDVSAGSLQLWVPDETYDVVEDVSAGSFVNEVQTSSSSPRTISATVSAGSAEVRPGN